MNRQQIATIKAELIANPTLYPSEYTDLNNFYVAKNEFNALDKPGTNRVAKADLIKYLSANDLLISIIDEKNNASAVKARPARSIMWLLDNSLTDDIDVNDAAFTVGIETLVTNSILTQIQADEIIVMGNKLTSTAKILGLSKVRAGNIQEALK